MAKLIEVTTLDHPRRMGYTYANLKELSRLMNGLPFFGSDTQPSMLGRLSGLDPNALSAFMYVGLRTGDRKLTMEQADEVIQEFLDKGGRPADLIKLIHEALTEAGFLRTEKAEDDESRPRSA